MWRQSKDRVWRLGRLPFGRKPTACGWALAAALAAVACRHGPTEDEMESVGLLGASSHPLDPINAPIVAGDLETIAQRGRVLASMHRALELALPVLDRTGVRASGDLIIALADVDPGFRSAQVVFVRWPAQRGRRAEAISPENGRAWLRVSLQLEPSQVLSEQVIDEPLDWQHPTYRRAEAIFLARRWLSSDFANTTFELFAFTESPRDKHVSAVRVHALGQPRGPDVDFVLAARRRKRSAKIERASVVHEVPAGEKGPLNTSGPQPAPAAVARALIRGGSDDFQVETSSGTWWVSPTSGAIRR